MARKPAKPAAVVAEDADVWGDEPADVVNEAPEFVAITVLAEGVRVDGSGTVPVGMTVWAPANQAMELIAEGKAQ